MGDNDGLDFSRYDFLTITLGALAANNLALVNGGTTLQEDLKALHCKYFMTYLPGSIADSEGPLLVGWCPGDMTDAEVEEALEAAQVNPNDFPGNEHSNRPTFPLEVVMAFPTAAVDIGSKIVAQGEFKPRWRITDGQGWRWWAYNFSPNALTDGGSIKIAAKWFGRWLI